MGRNGRQKQRKKTEKKELGCLNAKNNDKEKFFKWWNEYKKEINIRIQTSKEERQKKKKKPVQKSQKKKNNMNKNKEHKKCKSYICKKWKKTTW